MKLPVDIPRRPTQFAAILLFFLPLIAGCANPGPPHPPSLHLPEVVSDLSAERIGAEVRLHWTTPGKTTDGINVSGPMTAQVCRGSSPSTCLPTQSIPVKPGPSEATDPLPSALIADPQALLEYRVAIRNNHQRSAGPSSPAFAAAGSAPPAVSGLRVEAAEQGAELQWTPSDAADAIELDRLHKIAAASSPSPTGRHLQTAAKEPAEMRFHAATKATGNYSLFQADAGGSVDTTAHRGETYTYTAQRVRAVLLHGHALEIRSALSPAVTITMRDTFPPRSPAGLEAILAGQAAASPAIDLSWRPNVEPDLAGYVVYRQELGPDGAATGALRRLTATPVPEPGFHDATAVAGHIYSYSVTAVDASGNESGPSAPAREDVPLR
jgi:hypothetical protein